MKPHRLLYLNTHQLTAYVQRSGLLQAEATFAQSAEGVSQFADYLARSRKLCFAMVVNIAEEGFQTETIPFLRGKSRQEVIQRKLEQLFFNAPMTAALSVGYEKSQRRNERVLLASLSNRSILSPWLAEIEASNVALAGIYSLPSFVPTLLQLARRAERTFLLITAQDQSIRQSFVRDGQLVFSRMTPLTGGSGPGLVQSFAIEATKLQQYLTSQRLLTHGQPITAFILAHSSCKRMFEETCADSATLHFEMIDVGDCARTLGLRSGIQDSSCELLFLHLAAATPPKLQFANDRLRHNYHLLQLNAVLRWLGALALLTCVIFAVITCWETASVRQEIDVLRRDIQSSRQNHARIIETLPAVAADGVTLRHLIDNYTRLEQENASPGGMYQEISRALDAVPSADIDSIAWQVGSKAAINDKNMAVPLPPPPAGYETAIISGSIRPQRSVSPKQLIQIFEQLVAHLRDNPNLDITVIRHPFEIESGKSFAGGDNTIDDASQHTFTVQISRKLLP